MEDEFLSYSTMPDLMSVIKNKNQSQPLNDTGFDPYKLMLQKKQIDNGESIDTTPNIQYKEEDIKKLQDYCTKMGILGVNFKGMNPLATLAMLKKQMGDVDSNIPLAERVPFGYQKIGGNPNKKLILG